MTEMDENQEVENQEVEDQEVEGTTLPIIEEVPRKTIKELAQEARDDAAFAQGDNQSFYLASKAYHDDRDYEESIQKFQAAIEYTEAQSDSLDENDVDVIVKSMYWTAESYVEIEASDKAIEVFEALVNNFSVHYLGLAARRRIETLKASH